MRRLPRQLAIAVGGMCALAALAGCSQGAQAETANTSSPAVNTVPITLDDSQPITIGVIVSLTSAPGQGADWASSAEGAEVAAYRLNQGGSKVTLAVADDKGTADGARTAVQTLSAKGASGIVLATTGDHVSGALEEANKDGLPMVMPYGCPDNSQPHLWCTGTTAKSSGQAIQAALASKKAHNPLIIDIGGGVPQGVSGAQVLHVDPAIQMADLLTQVSAHLTGTDAIVVSGAAPQLAEVVGALQGAGISQPVILSGAATSPAFTSAASAAEVSMSGQLLTIGTNTGDAAALQAGDDGTALSAYLAAVRAAAADPQQKSLFGDQPFAQVAGSADVASHDAVIALASAAAAANSTDPAKVASSLSDLKLTHADGLAGPALDFGSSDALAANSVVPLQASTDNPGLRPQTAAASDQLCWIAVPH